MVLDKFRFLNRSVIKQPEEKKEANKKSESPRSIVLANNTVNITLADQAPIASNYVVVHNLADYRRKSTSILLVPDVEATIDIFLFSREEAIECIPTL